MNGYTIIILPLKVVAELFVCALENAEEHAARSLLEALPEEVQAQIYEMAGYNSVAVATEPPRPTA